MESGREFCMTTVGQGSGRHPVSVILSSYNQPNALSLALAGLRAQDDTDFELLIADDGSQADVQEAVRALLDGLPFPVRFFTQEDQGFRKARILNSAVLQARGRQLIFTDGDCVPFRNLVSTHRRAFREGCFCTGGCVYLTLEQSRSLAPEMIARGDHEAYLTRRTKLRMRWIHFKNGLYRLLGKKWKPKIKGGNFSVDREALVAIDGFDEAFEGMSGFDSDTRNRLRSSGARGISLWHRAHVCHLDHGLDPRRVVGVPRRRRNPDLYYGRRGQVKALKGLSTRAEDGG
jgi:glycosyltransferase involved in cell wall biosynthesis